MHMYCRYVLKVKYLYSLQIWEILSSFTFKPVKLLTDPRKKKILGLYVCWLTFTTKIDLWEFLTV